ncbi:UNVERIFIED_CONTAM: Retrovirus-related Pol polyprotein from transposon RE2 [Sesamum indicum]
MDDKAATITGMEVEDGDDAISFVFDVGRCCISESLLREGLCVIHCVDFALTSRMMADEVASSTMGQRPGEMAAQYEKDVLSIHPSEHAQLSLTSSPLDGTNFLVWRRAVYVSLGTKMKLGFIDGSFPKPAAGSVIFEQWRRVDLMVTSWELSSMAQQDLSLTAYLTKITKLWNELNCLAPLPKCKCGGCSCGINEEIDALASLTQLMQFLMGLHEVFNNERSQILMLDPLRNVEKAFSMIFSVEQQRAIHTSIDMNSSNVAYQLNLKGNKREDDRYAQKKKFIANKRSLMCSHCHKPGHGQETCFQLHGVPDWYKSLNDRNAAEVMNQLLELLRKANVSPDPITNHANFAQFEEEFAGNVAKPSCIDLSTWIIDTGATNHKSSSICGLTLNDDITLNNVFFVPYFSVNLISVSQLCSHTDYRLHFTKDTCFLQDLENKTTKAIAHLFKNLYIFRQHPSCFTSAISADSVNCTSSLWHKRLGHASLQAVKRLVDIDLSIDANQIPCEICHKAMQTRVPFPTSVSHSNVPFDLIHMDLWGPYAAFNLLGGTYVLTLLDDYSRCLWTFVLKQKSQVPTTLKHFCSLILNQFDKRIKILRSDNGSEFMNHECQSLCSELGIIHQSSCTYTPQQNGRVKRKHRHLLNIARALLFQASLPIKFWGDAILTATFLINRTPSKLLAWKTPFELLHGHPPEYAYLRTFGSLCFATNINPHKSKFHPRALKCILIGYSMNQKAYKLFDIESNSVLFSKDVQFYEEVFPFSQAPASLDTILPLPMVPLDSAGSLHLHPDHTQSSISQPTPSGHIPASTPVSAPKQTPSPVVRRSSRITRRPLWLDDFVSVTSNPHIVHPSNAAYTSFVAPVSILQEPKSFQEATRHQQWIDAMKAELNTLEDNQTWILTPLPAGKKPIGSVQSTPCGEGLHSSSWASANDKVRVFLSIAAAHNWPLQQRDVNNAFLHGCLEEDLYMKPLEGYPVQKGLVCKLQRSLYGLKQASRQWNVKLTAKLTDFGFTQSAYDHCFYTKKTDNGLLALLVYVDDIIVTTPSLELIQIVKDYLHSLFTIKDLGNARYFLGLEIARSSDGLYLAQTKYVRDIIKDTGMSAAKSIKTPFPLGLKLATTSGAPLSQPDQYRRLIGRLLYLGFTSPDISHSVQQLSQFLTRPCDAHWRATLHVVRYLKGEPSKGLFFPATCNFELTAYCDADWALCTDSRRSLTGYCIFLGAALVSWKTKKQSTVSRSTAEAEYRSMAATVCELKWLSYLLSDFNITLPLPVRLFCDNQAALHIMANPVFHERTEHIEIDCHVVRSAYKDGFLTPLHIRNSLQLADIFTKSLPLKTFAFLLAKLGLAALHLSPTCGGAVELGNVSAMDDKAATVTGIDVEDGDDAISFVFDVG